MANFIECAPRVVTCGDEGWQFIKNDNAFAYRYASAKKISPEAKAAKERLSAYRKDAQKRGLCGKDMYVDPTFKKLRDEYNELDRGRLGPRKEVRVQVLEYTGSTKREARKALSTAIKGMKLLWKEAEADPQRFANLIRKCRDGDITSSFEEMGETGRIEYRKPEYDCCDRYDFGPWTRN